MWKWEADRPIGVVVIIHGAAEHHGRYRWLIEMFRSSGFHVVMGDLPGQGTTTRNRGHIESFDDYIIEVNNWIVEAKKFGLPLFILGHSMGGLIAIRSLQEQHEGINGAILSSPCLGLVNKPKKLIDTVSKGLNIFAPKIKVDSGLSVEVATRNKEVRDHDENDTLYVTKVSIRWYRELVKAIELAHGQTSKFPDVPLLVMQGGEDKIIDKSAVQKWFNKLEISEKAYKEWKDDYHEIFNEPDRDLVFNTARRFFEAHLE